MELEIVLLSKGSYSKEVTGIVSHNTENSMEFTHWWSGWRLWKDNSKYVGLNSWKELIIFK